LVLATLCHGAIPAGAAAVLISWFWLSEGCPGRVQWSFGVRRFIAAFAGVVICDLSLVVRSAAHLGKAATIMRAWYPRRTPKRVTQETKQP
jgi:hypothetical protein